MWGRRSCDGVKSIQGTLGNQMGSLYGNPFRMDLHLTQCHQDPPPVVSTIVPAPRKKLVLSLMTKKTSSKMADTKRINQSSAQGSGRTLQQRKEDLFDEYELFRAIGNESIHDYFVRFHKLVNDMKINQFSDLLMHLKAYEPHVPKRLSRNRSSLQVLRARSDMFQLAEERTCFLSIDGIKAPMLLRFHGQLSATSDPTIHSMRSPEEHLDSDAETEIDDNTIPYHQYLLDIEAQNVPTEVSADTSDKVSMIAI
ncbi:hypothetical protein Tco_1368211 [Tanacetum coccineum]